MALPPLPNFESWVPAAVIDAAKRLNSELAAEKNQAEGLAVLARLISDPRMRSVWTVLYQKKRNDKYKATDEFFHPARVTRLQWAAEHRKQARALQEKGGDRNESEARLLEAEASAEEAIKDSSDPRWSEQDLGVQLFFRHACHSAINIQPTYLADINAKVANLRKISASLREHSEILKSLGLKSEAQRLEEIAADCEDEARIAQPNLETDDPWIIVRDRGHSNLRTYIVDLSISAATIFGTHLYGTLATVANVVFPGEAVTDAKVRDLLR